MRRCNNGKNPRWPMEALFVDRPEHKLGEHNKTNWRTSQTSFEKKYVETSWRRCDSKIVTVLSKGEVASSKMAFWRPY